MNAFDKRSDLDIKIEGLIITSGYLNCFDHFTTPLDYLYHTGFMTLDEYVLAEINDIPCRIVTYF